MLPLFRLAAPNATGRRAVHTPCEHGTPEWHAARARYELTASTVPDIMGPGIGYRSRGKRFRLICGLETDSFTPYQASLMEQGTQREPEALALLAETNPGLHVRPPNGMFHNSDYEWLGCTPDGTFNHGSIVGPLCPIEIKCPARTWELEMQWKKWLRWRIQLEVQMRCMDAPRGILWVYHPVQSCIRFDCVPNDKLWCRILRECGTFRDYVRRREAPPNHTGDDDYWHELVTTRLEFSPWLCALEKWDMENLYFP